MSTRFQADPDAAALTIEPLARLDAALRGWVDSGKLPFIQIAIWRGEALGHYASYGLRDRERDLPVTDDTIVRIYSMTKPVTSVALMQLFEQGKVLLEDPVEKYIPEFAGLRVYVAGNHPNFMTRQCDRPMTVRDVLTHQSGLTYGFLERTNVDAAYRKLEIGGGAAATGTLRDTILQVAGLPLEFSPGDHWNYSVSTDVCGYLVEVISGQPLDVYFREHIFEPLGMEDTAFNVPAEKKARFAANYSMAPGGPLELLDDPETSAYTGDVTSFSPGGGLVSTTEDYLRFCRMLLDEGSLEGTRVIGRKTLELMTVNHLPPGTDLGTQASVPALAALQAGTGFGLGFSVVTDLATTQLTGSPGAFAWGGAASTVFWVDPMEELTVVFMTQLLNLAPSSMGRELRAMVYAALD